MRNPHALPLLVALTLMTAACYASPGDELSGAPSSPTGGAPALTWGPSSTPHPLPAGLVDRSWYAQAADGSWVVGTIAGTSRISIPADERPVAAGPALVVTAQMRSVDGSYKTEVRILRLDGAPAPAVPELRGDLNIGAFAGAQTVILTGMGETGKVGPDVVAIDVETGRVSTLIEAGPVAATRILAVSPSGTTVLASVCDFVACRSDVIRMPGGMVTGAVDVPGIPRQVSDDTLKFNNDDATKIGAQDLASGKVLWTKVAEAFEGGYLTAGGTIVQPRVVLDRGLRVYEIVLVELRTGTESVLYSRPIDDATIVLWPELSNNSVAVLGAGYFVSDAGREETVSLTTVDLGNGELAANAYQLAIEANR